MSKLNVVKAYSNNNNPTYRVYVSTVEKVKSGSGSGAWVRLDQIKNNDDLYRVCQDIHADEVEPVFTITHTDNIPSCFILEDGCWFWLDKRFFEFVKIQDDDKDSILLVMKYFGIDQNDYSLTRLLNGFVGVYDSLADYAKYVVENCGYSVDERLVDFIDYNSLGESLVNKMYVWTIDTDDNKKLIMDMRG